MKRLALRSNVLVGILRGLLVLVLIDWKLLLVGEAW
jgi:hypothetical protein